MSSLSSFSEEEALRVGTYLCSFLSFTLDYPSAELLRALTDENQLRNFREIMSLLQKCCEGEAGSLLAELEATLSVIGLYTRERTEEELLLELQKEYTYLFFASRPRRVHLFESVYREGRLYGESTVDVMRFYRIAGLEVHPPFNLPPDSISLELEFMAYLFAEALENLCSGNRDAYSKVKELLVSFFNNHFHSFALQFADKLEKESRIEFYKRIARLLREAVNWCSETLRL